jgi:hypothetical protein
MGLHANYMWDLIFYLFMALVKNGSLETVEDLASDVISLGEELYSRGTASFLAVINMMSTVISRHPERPRIGRTWAREARQLSPDVLPDRDFESVSMHSSIFRSCLTNTSFLLFFFFFFFFCFLDWHQQAALLDVQFGLRL